MTDTIILESSEPSEIKNVVSYERFHCEPKWKITRAGGEEQPVEEYYFFMDCPGDDAFMHWVVESFIFYPLLLEKLETYPALKILTSNTKRYCKNFFKFIGLTTPIVSQVSSSRNVVFFPPIVSLNKPNMPVFIKYITNYTNNLKFDTFSPINLLYLPRNSIENYTVNDRTVPSVQELSELTVNKGGVVIDTYLINNIALQMNIINAAQIIVVHWGSAFYVNCIHLKNKTIVLLDSPIGVNQVRSLEIMNYLYRTIASNNKIISVFSYTSDLKDILDSLVV